MAHAVFISYARENANVANAIVELLEEINIPCWIDRNTIAHRHGEEWADGIVAAITSSRLMIVVLSKHANASKYVKSEVHKAFDLDIPIIPFRIEEVAPQGSLELHLPSSQWLDAFPLFEKHLDTLANSVCRLLDATAGAAAPEVRRSTKLGWQRYVVGHASHLLKFAFGGGSLARTAGPAESSRGKVPEYVARKAAHEAAAREDVRVLAKANRWWRIKEIIDSLEAQGISLGQYAQARGPLEKRLAEFERARTVAEEMLLKLGPSRSVSHVAKLQELVADHPFIPVLNGRRDAMLVDRGQLQKTLDRFGGESRWTAVENVIRGFVLKHRQATPSLLEAAHKASARALAETRRCDLVLWTIMTGAAILAACCLVEGWLGIADGSFAVRLSDTVEPVMVPAVETVVRFGTVVTVAGFALAAFGVRHQGTFAGASIALMIAAAASQAIPWGASLIPWVGGAPEKIVLAVAWLPCAIFAIAMAMALEFATSLLIGARATWPGLTMAICAALAGYGFMPERGIGGADLGSPGWSRWLPDAFMCGGLLAASGGIDQKRAWWIFPLFAIGAGFLGPTPHWSGYDGYWGRTGPVIIVLLVAGWLAARPTTVRGYLVLLMCACAACFTADFLRGLDVRSGMMPFGRLAPLLSLWAIACGSVAIRRKAMLSPNFRGWDILNKQLLRLRSIGSDVHDRQLADTVWFRAARDWHAKQPR